MNTNKPTENEAIRATHVQNPAEIEHVADDVSKNGAETNMNAYAELPPSVGEYKYGGGLYTDAQMRVFADATHALRAQQPAPATQQAGVVAYLDIGAGGYLDLGSELSDEALQQLPKGRHALVIAGTYGIDGYVAAPQPTPTAQADSQPAPVSANHADLPPLPDPDMRDVGTAPGGIKEFLRGYATEYAKAAIAARKQGGA